VKGVKLKISIRKDRFNIWKWRHQPGRSVGEDEAKVLDLPSEGELKWYGATVKFDPPLHLKKGMKYWTVIDVDGKHMLATQGKGQEKVTWTEAEVKMQGNIPKEE
jgi:hypothetical protein